MHQSRRPFRAPLWIASTVALIAVCAPAVAKTHYIEQTVSTEGVPGQPAQAGLQKIWIMDKMVRFEDESSGMTTIVRQDLGKVFMIQGETYYEMTMDQIAAFSAMGSAMMQGQGGAEPKVQVTETGQTTTVGEWKAREIKVNLEGGMMPMAITLWVSKDTGMDQQAWTSFAEAIRMQGPLGQLADALAKVDGFPVRQQSEMSVMGMKIRSSNEVKVVKTVEDDPTRFKPSDKLKKVPSPLDHMSAPAGAGAGG